MPGTEENAHSPLTTDVSALRESFGGEFILATSSMYMWAHSKGLVSWVVAFHSAVKHVVLRAFHLYVYSSGWGWSRGRGWAVWRSEPVPTDS